MPFYKAVSKWTERYLHNFSLFHNFIPKFFLKNSTIPKKCSGHTNSNEEDDEEEEDSDEGREREKKKIEKLFFDFDKWSIVVDEKWLRQHFTDATYSS